MSINEKIRKDSNTIFFINLNLIEFHIIINKNNDRKYGFLLIIAFIPIYRYNFVVNNYFYVYILCFLLLSFN